MNSNQPEESSFRKKIYLASFFTIILTFFLGIFILCSCQYVPQIMDDVKDIATDDAITIKCDRDCFQKQTDVEISVKVINKDKEAI